MPQFTRHADRCAKVNEDKIGEALAIKEDSAFTRINDKELYEWTRKKAAKS